MNEVEVKPMFEVTKVTDFLTAWEGEVRFRATQAFNLTRVDVSNAELQRKKVIDQDESFIGVKVIQVTINRELPHIFSFLTESSRFLLFEDIPELDARRLELKFAKQARAGLWTFPFMQAYYAGAMMGKGFVEVVCDESNPIGTKVEFVSNLDLAYPTGCVNIQQAGLLARRFEINTSYLRTFGRKLLFKKEEIEKIETKQGQINNLKTTSIIYKLYYRDVDTDNIMCCWFSQETNSYLTDPVLHCSGAFGKDGTAIPSQVYPFCMFRYSVSADTQIRTFQGRADLDEPVQEAIQALLTSYVNGSVRASGFYPYLDNGAMDPGRQVRSLPGNGLQHNRIADAKLGVFQPNYPDSSMLSAAQVLRTGNAQDAGQTDFATINKRVANTTAKEIQESVDQSNLMSSVGVSMMAMFMYTVESMRFEILRYNLASTNIDPNDQALLSKVRTVSVIDQLFKSRDEKMQLAKQWFPIIKETPAAIPFMLALLQVDLPEYVELIKANLQDPKDLVKGMLGIFNAFEKIDPEITQDPNYVKIKQLAEQVSASGGIGGEAGARTGNVGSEPNDPNIPIQSGNGMVSPNGAGN